MTTRFTDWCILRTAPSQTVNLAASLTEDGFDVWAPKVTGIARVGRSRKRREVTRAIAPGFVFARYDQVRDLVALSHRPVLTYRVYDRERGLHVNKGHPRFSVFRYLEAFPWVADRELDALRLEEQRARPKAKAEPLADGTLVKHPENGFEGMVGKVQGSKGRFALVIFEGPSGLTIPVHIEPRNLIRC